MTQGRRSAREDFRSFQTAVRKRRGCFAKRLPRIDGATDRALAINPIFCRADFFDCTHLAAGSIKPNVEVGPFHTQFPGKIADGHAALTSGTQRSDDPLFQLSTRGLLSTRLFRRRPRDGYWCGLIVEAASGFDPALYLHISCSMSCTRAMSASLRSESTTNLRSVALGMFLNISWCYCIDVLCKS
jgi:hypothetical protein